MSALLLTTADEVSALVPLQAQFSDPMIKPHLTRAQRDFLKPALGIELLDRLADHIADEESDDTEVMDGLLELVQEALAHRAVLYALPFLSIDISNAGLQILANEQFRPPYQWQVGDLQSSLDAASMNAIEAVYAYLEEHRDSFEEWTESEVCTQFNDTLLRTAIEFDQHYPIGGSRVTFLDLKPAVRRAQAIIIGNKVGQAFLDEMVARLKTDDSDDAELLDTAIDKLRPALANLAISEAKELVFRYSNGALVSTRLSPNAATKQTVIDDRLTYDMLGNIRQQAYDSGMKFLAIAMAWLNDNADDLPTFKDGPGYVVPTDNTVAKVVERRIPRNDGGMML